MGHYTGPKARINRRLGALIFENNGAKKAFDRRDAPPGMHVRRGKPSGYALALTEQQKIKYYYGLSQAQLRRLYDLACRMPGNSGEQLMLLCEQRIDNAIRLAGFTKTRPQARQGINHGHFRLNGVKHDVTSTFLKPNDAFDVKPTPQIRALYNGIIESDRPTPPNWLQVDYPNMFVKVLRKPMLDEVTLPVNVQLVVELLSR